MANYVADFETHVPPKEILDRLDRKKYPKTYLKRSDIKTWVWGYGLTEVGNTDDCDIELGSSIDQFMNSVKKLNNPTIYFHNLKFDGHFIMSWAFKNGYKFDEDGTKQSMTFNIIVSQQNQFYKIELIHKRRKKGYTKTTFYDSMKKLPMPLAVIGKGFKLDFGKMEVDENYYLKYREEGGVLSELDKAYIRLDIKVLSQALQIQFNQGLTKMTIGSDALGDYKKIIGKKQFELLYPVLDLDLNAMILLAYRGGWTYSSDKFRGKTVGKGIVYDVNSLYPSVMYDNKMPYGRPLFYVGEYEKDLEYDLYIQELDCEFKLKEDYLPTIQIKGLSAKYPPTEYIKESQGLTKLHLTNVDLDLFFEHYDVWNLEFTCGLKFRSRYGLFTEYIDKWNGIKEVSDGAIRELAKLQLNNLYGKFGTRPDVTGKDAFYEDNLVVLRLGDEEIREPVYTATAVWTTSYGRNKTIREAQKNFERFAYADTDSIHLVGEEEAELEMHPTKLGLWSIDAKFKWAKFIGSKCYVEEVKNKKGDWELEVTVAGMPKNMHKMITKDNFDVGLKLFGKKMPIVVDGGVVLVDKSYELKIRGFMGGY